ncbi:SAM domain-containing protein [Meloidogyne graminicola]|uniref:SAM domain-containing protein n=1 Tax=Meloidogyne graminicola TaxID=189291 RepID=A0A8S9ZT17_9BILA|nr:SAM domain-containing protein [Meloidogyne graminicola]
MFILIIILQLLIISATFDKKTKNIKITAEDEKILDPEGYLAIKAIHGVLDNDQSGSIERYESADFLTEDFKFGESDRQKREKAFHENDESITIDDLWEAWFQSDVREWGEKQVIDWLVNGVKLPQYVNNFMKEGIVGTDFPRLAIQNSSIFNLLDIKNSVHRQKLQLKALDLVLFGSQDSSSLIKDIALASLLISLITYKNRAKKQMEELSTRLSKLRDMETDFEGVQQKLDEENKVQQSTDENNIGEPIKGFTYNPVLDFENDQRLPLGGNLIGGGCMDGGEHYLFLQTLLRKTYEIESAYLDKQRTDCLNEMREAMELVDKMRRKQSSIVNSLKLATGATSGTTDDIDIKIFNLKARMEKIKQGIEELVQRWMKIESICGFSITGPFAHNNILSSIINLSSSNNFLLNSNNIFGYNSLSFQKFFQTNFPHINNISSSSPSHISSSSRVAQSHESIPIMGIKQIERIRSNNLQQQPQNMHNNNNNNTSNEYSSINSEHQHNNGPQFQFAYQQLSSTNPFVRPLSRQSASTSMLSVDSSLPNKTKKNRFKQLFRRYTYVYNFVRIHIRMIKTRKRQHSLKEELTETTNVEKTLNNKKLKIEEEENKHLTKQNENNEEKPIQHVIRISNVPYGFFEKEMNGYFSQFGDVKRVRVMRNKKGNHTGFAFVEFKNGQVAEIAAKSMDNYLLAEKKLRCSVVEQKHIPKCIQGGKRFGKIIEPGENRLKETLKRFEPKNKEQERLRLARFVDQLKEKMLKIKSLGICYEFNFEQKLENYLKKEGIEKLD